MSDKVIYRLPVLGDGCEWACAGGCSNVEPLLYRHVYKQVVGFDGALLLEEAEYFYTCGLGGRSHALKVWNEVDGDYVVLPYTHYQEQDNEYDLDLEVVESVLSGFEDTRKDFLNNKFFSCANLSLEIINRKTGEVITLTEAYVKEVQALLVG